jgi:hypothetical protein
LGVEPEAAVLPCVVPCPLKGCKGHLTLYHDESAGGAWCYCRGCKFAGDVIELAAAHWDGLELPVVIRKLMALGVDMPEERVLPVNVDQYILYHPGKRKRLWDFWQQSRHRLLVDDSKVLRGLQHKLGLRLGLDRDRWLQGPGMFVGGTGKHAVEACFQPTVAQHSRGLQNAGAERVFSGPGWTDVLTIPFSDLPGRIKGFLFIGREGNLQTDSTFRLVRYSSAYVQDRRTGYKRGLETNCGLALYNVTEHANDGLIVMSDPVLALRMQCWHMQDNSVPADVVSMYADSKVRTSPDVWRHVRQKPLFWGVPTAEMFRHARAVNAKVCTAGFTRDGPLKSFTKTPLAEWLVRVRKNAQPWDVALEALLSELPIGDAETILLGMELTPAEMQQFVTKCPEMLRLRLEPLFLRTPVRTVLVNGVAVSEDQGWYNEQTREEICSAILRIEQVIHHDRIDQTYYAGRILFKGHEVSFCAPADEVETDTFKWMRARLLKAGAGYMEYAPKWEVHAAAIATKFHQPEVLKGFNSIGWDEERACFVFPTYLLSSKGEVVDDPGIKVPKRRTPALMLEKPSEIVAGELPSGEGSAVFWATAAAVASNLLAPVFGAPTCGIGLVGGSGEATGKASARMLGCAEHSVQDGHWKDEGAVSDVCAEHKWPLLLKPPKTHLEEWAEWLSNGEQKNCIVPLDWYTAKSLVARPGWYVIEAGNYVATMDVCDAARKTIPSFLQYVTKQQFKLPARYGRTDGTSFIHIVLVWMSQWFTSIGGDYKVVTNALKVSSFDGDDTRGKRAADSFIDLLCRLFDEGELVLERAGFIPAGKSIRALICFPGESGSLGKIFVPKAVVNKLLALHNAPALDVTALSHALAVAGTAEEHEYAGLSGWLIDEGAWNERIHRWRAWHRYKLRVTS